MEFQESNVMKFIIHKSNVHDKKQKKWKITFHKPKSFSSTNHHHPPKQFMCSISGTLMADPVIVSSGHTFERNCVEACKNLNFRPTFTDDSTPDFSTVIPNLAIKTTIFNFCSKNGVKQPRPIDLDSAMKLVRKLKLADLKSEKIQYGNNFDERELINGVSEIPVVKKVTHAASEITRRVDRLYTSSSESVGSTRLLPLATRPSCYSASNSSEIEVQLNPNSEEDVNEEILAKIQSSQLFEVEHAVILLRNRTRTVEESRVSLCIPRVLSALRSLIVSRYTTIQVNSVAALVNLSLENANKVMIVRSGIVPHLIEVLKGGSPEAQEHASGALFSLALEDVNKTAIGVLGGLQPLLRALRSDSERTQSDSALALYHLTLVQSNRSKLIKLGAVSSLLNMVKSGHLTSRVMLILCNLVACPEGRAAMLDAGAVEFLVGILKSDELNSATTRESCVVALHGLSQGGLRFKGLAMEAGATEVLRKVIATGKERAREKAKRILEVMRGREEEEEIDWEELIDSGLKIRNRCRLGGGGFDESGVNSSEF